MPTFYKRYVNDTLSIMPDVQVASTFLSTLNDTHSSISYDGTWRKRKLPFLEIVRNSTRLDRKVYRKPTDTGLLLHYYSHVDMKYKHSLLKTMLNRAFKRPFVNQQNVLSFFKCDLCDADYVGFTSRHLTSTCWGTQTIDNRQPCKGTTWQRATWNREQL